MRCIGVLTFTVCCSINMMVNADDILAGADLSYGEYLSGECVTCHRQDGVGKGIPAINGLDPEVFASIILAYKAGEMEHPVMQMVASRLDAEQIASLAVYFAGLAPSK